MLVYVRPSNEALLRARVPGAQDQRGALPFLLRSHSTFFQGVAWLDLQLRTSNDHRFIVGVP